MWHSFQSRSRGAELNPAAKRITPSERLRFVTSTGDDIRQKTLGVGDMGDVLNHTECVGSIDMMHDLEDIKGVELQVGVGPQVELIHGCWVLLGR